MGTEITYNLTPNTSRANTLSPLNAPKKTLQGFWSGVQCVKKVKIKRGL